MREGWREIHGTGMQYGLVVKDTFYDAWVYVSLRHSSYYDASENTGDSIYLPENDLGHDLETAMANAERRRMEYHKQQAKKETELAEWYRKRLEGK
jgi:hypothetical protein